MRIPVPHESNCSNPMMSKLKKAFSRKVNVDMMILGEQSIKERLDDYLKDESPMVRTNRRTTMKLLTTQTAKLPSLAEQLQAQSKKLKVRQAER